MVVAHTVLSHVPEPDRVLAEACRVLRPGGTIAVFDGAYATISVARSPTDPLQACASVFAPAFINDPWLGRRLPVLLRRAGFRVTRVRGDGDVQVDNRVHMLSIVDRGADALVASDVIGPDLAEPLKVEARRRAAEGAFYGTITYTITVGHKPDR